MADGRGHADHERLLQVGLLRPLVPVLRAVQHTSCFYNLLSPHDLFSRRDHFQKKIRTFLNEIIYLSRGGARHASKDKRV